MKMVVLFSSTWVVEVEEASRPGDAEVSWPSALSLSALTSIRKAGRGGGETGSRRSKIMPGHATAQGSQSGSFNEEDVVEFISFFAAAPVTAAADRRLDARSEVESAELLLLLLWKE